MKRITTIMMAAAVSAMAIAQTPVNKNATPEAKKLLEVVYSYSGKSTLTGQHSYPLFSDIYFERANHQCGAYPVVCGQDFGYSEPNSLDGINFRQRTIDNCIKWHEKGAIITLMWHAVPPTTKSNYTTWQGTNGIQSDLTDEQWKALFTEGSEVNLNWKSQVDVVAFFLRQLQELNIPVIWRPYHEMNGDWFWWGYRPKDYIKLYRMLYDRLTNYHGLNNLIWVFNANETGSSNVKPYADFYPGADVVDILATDVYSGRYDMDNYNSLLKLADGKPIALGECGPLPTPEILKQQPKWTWFMTWCEFLETVNDWDRRRNAYNCDQTTNLAEFIEQQKK